MQPNCTVTLDDFVTFVGNAGIKKQESRNVTKLLNMLSKHGAKILADVVKEILQDQGCALPY